MTSAQVQGIAPMLTGKEEDFHTVQDFTRFSDSHVWKLMTNYYANAGVTSWANYRVPYFITCNSFIAKKYVLFLYELLRSVPASEKVYIIEIGAGSGKLGFHMLRAIDELPSDVNKDRITYVLSDFAQKNVDFWRWHMAFKPYVQSGRLDFATFNIYTDDAFALASGGTIPAGANVAVIANYIFDTMSADAFRVEMGKLMENRLAIRTKAEEPDKEDPKILQRMHLEWKAVPCKDDFYAEPYLNEVLAWYKRRFADSIIDANVILPVTILRFFNRIITNVNPERLWCIAGDKAFTECESFTLSGPPHLALHDSFSIMANMHAVGLYFQHKGGVYMHNPQADAGIKVSCFAYVKGAGSAIADVPEVLNKERMPACGITSAVSKAFEYHICDFGPTDFFTAQKTLAGSKELAADGALMLIKLSNYDTDTFYNVKEIIVDQIITVSRTLRQDIYRALTRIWNNYYSLNRDRDLAFEFGRLFFKTREFRRALEFYEYSLRTMGEHNVTLFNIGLCQRELGNKDEALEALQKSVRLDPTFERARILLLQMHAEAQVTDVAIRLSRGETIDLPDMSKMSTPPPLKRAEPPKTVPVGSSNKQVVLPDILKKLVL